MRQERSLERLVRAVKKSLRRLRHDVAMAYQVGNVRYNETVVSRVTIEALNIWANFSRSFYLSGILCPRRIGGTRIGVYTPRVSEQVAIENAIITWRPHLSRRVAQGGRWHRREEPTWHDPQLLQSICTAAGFSNMSEIQAAFSSGYRVFRDLPVVRNYFAHRNRYTRQAAVNIASFYGIPAFGRPSDILMRRPLRRPQSLVLEWIDELEFTSEYLCT